MKRKSKKHLTLIEWIDSHSPSSPGWIDPDDVDVRVFTCSSVGFVMDENETQVTLAAHIGGDKKRAHCVTGVMTIPKVAIISRTKLK